MKAAAPTLLREAFDARSWQGDVINLSGATDCYQPLEASYRLTRQCLEVFAEYRNPVAIVTKGALIERDLDVLTQIRDRARATITISIPFWDADTARLLEPGAPTPQRRMRTIERLAAAGLDVGIALAPMVIGLSNENIADLLTAAAAAGARRATLSFLRLPRPADAVFAERITALMPHRATKVLAHVDDAATPVQPLAKMIERVFLTTCQRLGLPCAPAGNDRANTPNAGPLEQRTFRRPTRQGSLFG